LEICAAFPAHTRFRNAFCRQALINAPIDALPNEPGVLPR